jgi:hypothetical protein
MDFSIDEREVKEGEEVKDARYYPGCFCQRVRKLLKRKDDGRKKSAKRDQESARERKGGTCPQRHREME